MDRNRPKKRDIPDGRQAYDVTPEQFIEAWQSSETASEAAEKLGMPKAIVLARASNYRSMNIKLKSMKSGKKGLDVSRLNRLISELNETHGVPEEEEPVSLKDKPLEISEDTVANIVRELLRQMGRG